MAIYKRPNSKYYWFKFYFDGELIQRSSQCTNKTDERKIESAYRTQLVLGKIGIKPKPEAPRFNDAVNDYLKWAQVKHAAKPNTYNRVKYSCEAPKKFFGKSKVNRIGQKDIENFVIWRSKQISRKTKDLITRDTINLELIALKTIFKRLVWTDILVKNPADNIKQLPENDRTFHVLTREEEKHYLLACPQPLQDVATLILQTGMRPKEIYQLRRENVSIAKGFLNVEHSKTKSSNRKIWLTKKASKVLQSRIERFQGMYLFPKGDTDGNEPTYQLNGQHSTARKRISSKFRLYDCRHTFATRHVENGTDLLTLAHLLGHSSLDEVMRYAHVNEKRKAEAIQNMETRRAKAV